jgi:energy-dependent translational throttle protein EttA
VLLLEPSGAPTDNLDLALAEALEEGPQAFEGTVIAVTHDRWFAGGFDRFVLFRSDGEAVETPEPVWDVRWDAARPDRLPSARPTVPALA